jgi:MoxR-like ATPase
MFKVVVDYPTYDDEVVVVQRVLGQAVELRTLLCPEDILKLQDFVTEIYVDPRVIEYAVTLVEASRRPHEHGLDHIAPAIMFGGSPRASINLIAGARALAFIRGRDYILPIDVAELARDVLRHRIILTYEGIAAGMTPDRIVGHLLDRYPPPRMDLGDRYVA